MRCLQPMLALIFNSSTTRVCNLMSMSSTNYNTLNVHEYIDAIEREIESEEPTFRARLRYQNKKPVIRSLIDMQTKDDFNKLLRTQQKQTEYDKMRDFCQNILQPRIRDLPPDERQKIPNFDAALEVALSKPADKGIQTFYRLASGREYKGRLIDLVSDLVPDEEQNCIQSMTPMTEDEVLIHAIDSIANDERDFERKDERIEAARKCIDYFQSNFNGNSGSNGDPASSKLNGLECEQACLNWLQDQNRKDDIVLGNVVINNYTTKSRQKYLNQAHGIARNVIWTQTVRNGITSEFDAVVLRPSWLNNNGEMSTSITEIWEAKYSMSPSSLHDVLSKKTPAIRALMRDDQLSISYNGNHHSLRDRNEGMVLGVFGSELLPPLQALGQLKSTAMSYALSADVDIAMNAIDSGIVELSVDILLHDLRKLRQKYVEASKDFDIVVKTVAA